MQVTKRNRVKEEFNIDKIHKVLEWAIDGISDVSISDIEMNAKLSIHEGISTSEIHNILIKSTNDLISEEHPGYQYVASRLLSYWLRKEVWGSDEPPRLYEHIVACVEGGKYDEVILEKFSKSEIHKIGKIIKHNRDEMFTYAGIQQLIDKYLIKDKSKGVIYETPQFAYMLIAMTCFMNYNGDKRLSYIKQAYDMFSTFKINLPTPIMAGVRTNLKQYASCILIDVDDSLKSIFSSNTAIGYYIAKRAGLGVGVGRIRPINSSIRGGEVSHTGLIPYLKAIQATVKSCSQGGIRGGSATVNINFFHPEIEDVLVLKNNAGTDDNRVRQLDYCIQLSKLFYERLISDDYITLFSSNECPDLYEAFGFNDRFDALYVEKEKSKRIKYKKRIKARALMDILVGERLETGRIYIMNIDNSNSHSSFKDKVDICNLCTEIIHPLKPLCHIDDDNAEIGVCILSAINMLETKIDELEGVCDIIVRMLDFLIDHQEYPVKAAEKFCKERRSLGVGLTNLAGFLAKNKTPYDSQEAINLVDEYCEHLQYNLLSSSSQLAKEFGPCVQYDGTKYSDGIYPYDTANKNALSLVTRDNNRCDWLKLKEQIIQNGLRHSTVSAQMPCESSSVIQNSTNGIEPIREIVSYKKSKSGVLKQVVPNIVKYSKYYTKAFDIKSNETMANIGATIQRWFDMGVSLNYYYNYSHYDNGGVPRSLMTKDILYAYKVGLKTLYYNNTTDDDAEQSCNSGACAI